MYRPEDWVNPYHLPEGSYTCNPDMLAYNVYEAGADAMLRELIKPGNPYPNAHKEHKNDKGCFQCGVYLGYEEGRLRGIKEVIKFTEMYWGADWRQEKEQLERWGL